MAEKMLAVIKKEASVGAELIETEIPVPQPDEVLIKVRACSICGTDKHIYNWDDWAASRIRPPMIFGHECCGEVVEIGAGVKNISVGDYISAETHIPCRHCYQCKTGNMHLCKNLVILGVDRSGIFAEYAAIPEICCWKNHKSMPIEIASIQEPFGNAVYTVMESNVSAKRIAIIGDGPIAAFACGIAKAMGAALIYNLGMMPFNLDVCGKMGANVSINVTKEKEYRKRIIDETNGGVDVVLDMAGNKPAMAKNIVFKGVNIIGINGRKMFKTWYQMKNILDYKLVDPNPVISHTMPFKDIIKAMEMAVANDVDTSKIVLIMP